jgi:hypothetical protein
MAQQEVAKRDRAIVFSLVVLLHLATLAALLATSRRNNPVEPEKFPIQLVFVAPTPPPKALVTNIVPRPVRTDIALTAIAPVSVSSLQTGAPSGSDGRGSSVNWMAEAHRALRAFEIRRDQIPSSALSVSTPLDELGSRVPHAGERVKTNNGDWIVWINANCYRVASGHSYETAFEAISAQTICKDGAIAARD